LVAEAKKGLIEPAKLIKRLLRVEFDLLPDFIGHVLLTCAKLHGVHEVC